MQNKAATDQLPQPQPKLWTGAFIALILIQTADLLTYNLVTPVMAKYSVAQGATLALAGFVVSAFGFAALIVRPLSGIIADRMGRKLIIIIAIVVDCLSQLAYAFGRGFAFIVCVRIIHGLFYALFGTTISALAIDTIPAARKSRGMGWFSLSYVFANALGPALGVFLSEQLGYTVMFVVAACIALISMPLLLLVKAKGRSNQAEKGAAPRVDAPARKPRHWSLNDFLSVRSLPLAATACAYLAIWGAISSFVVLIGDSRGVIGIGAFFVVNSFALLLTRPTAGRVCDKYGLAPLYYFTVVFEIIAILMIAFSGNIVLFLIAAVCKALGSGTVLPSIQATCADLEPPERSGISQATYLFGSDIGNIVGPLFGGAIAGLWGYSTMMLMLLPVLAIGVVVFTLWQVVRRKTHKTL
jgi:MFS family permease